MLFANLLENAAKYTPPATPIDISAVEEGEGDTRAVRVFIDDDGPGVPTTAQSRLFDKFTRGEKESAQPGIGLRLAICRAIVEAHGGQIGVVNREDENGRIVGARFWFTLPANETPPADLLHEDDTAAEGNDDA